MLFYLGRIWTVSIPLQLFGRRIIQNASCPVAISENEIPNFMEYGVSLESIPIIPNGVNNNDFLSDDVAGLRKKLDLEEIPFIFREIKCN